MHFWLAPVEILPRLAALALPPLGSGRLFPRCETMASGSVKFFNALRGFGFIEPADGGADVFCHIRDLRKTGLSDLKEGQQVKFDVEPGKEGKPRASNVTLAR